MRLFAQSEMFLCKKRMPIFFQPKLLGAFAENIGISIFRYRQTPAGGIGQLSWFPKMQKAQRRSDIDRTLDKIRGRYGYHSIRRAIALVDPALDLDAKGEHIIHPIGFLGTLHE